MAQSKIWYFESFTLLKNLPKEAMQMLEEKTVMQCINKNDFIYLSGDKSDMIFFLKEGKVKVGTYSPEGKEVIKSILREGEVFGELSLLGEDTRSDFAQAISKEVTICVMKMDEMLKLMTNNPVFSLRVTKLMAFRLRRIERRLESLFFKDAKTRVHDLLKDMSEEFGHVTQNQSMTFKQFLTHQDIANLTATSRQTVTSILNDLKQEGKLNIQGKNITVFPNVNQ